MRLQTCIVVLVVGLLGANAEFNDLQDFVRVAGSLSPNDSVANYFNGSVYYKQIGSQMQKIFNFEGFNVNRKLPQTDGTFLSLSREFVVYRDPITSHILQVWINPLSGNANEVFYVANDPVNGVFDSAPDNFKIPQGRAAYRVYNSDIVLEYPNALQPDKYPKYSAGPIYDSVELFGFFGNVTELETTQNNMVSMAGTWMRKSEFLPWMELGTTPGSLFYSALVWKCMHGLSCVADDIMAIVKSQYPKYQEAPTVEEVPNETSWTVFKKIIDARRQAGLPDIIIPQVNTSSNLRDMTYTVDNEVLNILYRWPLYVRFNGTAQSEITGKQAVPLFDVRGNIGVDVDPLPTGDGYRVQLDGSLFLLNHTTHQPLNRFNNPITGESLPVKYIQDVGIDMVFSKDSFYSINMPETYAVGLIGAQSMDDGQSWSVNLLNLLFPYQELARNTTGNFYGTFLTFSSWPTWMNMSSIQGNLVQKLTITTGSFQSQPETDFVPIIAGYK